MDSRRRSLEPGKLADFAILDRDLLTCAEEEIASVRVVGTWVNGKMVWEGKK